MTEQQAWAEGNTFLFLKKKKKIALSSSIV